MLTICPTPIGNLGDVTERQLEALADADIIACEDTRRAGKLLERLGIERRDGVPELISHHEHNETEAAERLIRELRAGREVVLVSDAGTPLISDPGFELVRRAIDAELEVRPLPGAAAVLVALIASGLPTHAFQFRGFPPSSEESRRRFLAEIDSTEMTTVMYASPHRIEAVLRDVVEVYGEEREICLAREMTKRHEEFLRGDAGDVLAQSTDREEQRGEFTLVVGPAPEDPDADDARVDDKIRELLDRGLRSRTIKEIVAELYDVPRSELYDRIQALDD